MKSVMTVKSFDQVTNSTWKRYCYKYFDNGEICKEIFNNTSSWYKLKVKFNINESRKKSMWVICGLHNNKIIFNTLAFANFLSGVENIENYFDYPMHHQMRRLLEKYKDTKRLEFIL